jgi:hypothetical protein
MIQEDLLVKVIDRIRKLNIPYMITGAIAAIFYGKPRLTHDFDIITDIKPEIIPKLIDAFKDEFYISLEAIQKAVDRHSMFNLIHHDSGIKVDFWMLSDNEFDKKRFERRKKHTYIKRDIVFSSAEDIILIKLLWFKESKIQKHLDDTLGILEVQQDMDFNYLEEWAKKLSIQNLFKELLRKVSKKE